ncbi:R3H domain-containing protein 2-like [Sphaerodactylus townsendi]|uniref:R3H domain-containing protein 2-like n=1 Tax=Sphaerodactylus townsendi TaxID=933632 RepID=UPI0020270C38|nr:R3H domain-containing protein 2-like [Sphaerodactylus townsendi]
MQLNVPNGPQPPQNPSMVQWNHCKYYSLDQRGQKPGDIYNPDTSAQASSTQLNSPLTSPTQSPTPSPVTSLNSVCTGLSPLPVLTQFPRPVGPAQGDGRYSLLGQPLQYNLSICPPPLLHNQSSYTAHQVRVGTGARGQWGVSVPVTQSQSRAAGVWQGLKVPSGQCISLDMCFCCYRIIMFILSTKDYRKREES